MEPKKDCSYSRENMNLRLDDKVSVVTRGGAVYHAEVYDVDKTGKTLPFGIKYKNVNGNMQYLRVTHCGRAGDGDPLRCVYWGHQLSVHIAGETERPVLRKKVWVNIYQEGETIFLSDEKFDTREDAVAGEMENCVGKSCLNIEV